jgi:hypothetical protein
MPYGRAGKKKDVAQGSVQPPNSDATYNGKPILPDYALVDVSWANPDFKQEELDIPTEEGYTFMGAVIGSRVLWNKADILFDLPTPASQRPRLGSSPLSDDLGDDDDDDGSDDNGDNGNDNAGGTGCPPRGSPPPDNGSPHGDIGAASGNVTPTSGSGSNKNQITCPPAPRKPADEQECPPSQRKLADEQPGEDILGTTPRRVGWPIK